MAIKILCVDDQIDALEAEKLLLQFEGYNANGAMTVRDAMMLIEHNQYDLFILDTNLPDRSGLDLCRWIRTTSKETPIIIYSGDSYRAAIDDAFRAGATKYLVKPASFDDILGAVQELTSIRPLTHAATCHNGFVNSPN
jgi:DNA-binding response OmpR family regulator